MAGKTKLIFIPPKTKINSLFYIEKELTPFITRDIPRSYPKTKPLFQQDIAPSHSAKATRKFLLDQKIDFITPERWPPNSPDLAPMDYGIWGYMKHELSKVKISDFPNLNDI